MRTTISISPVYDSDSDYEIAIENCYDKNYHPMFKQTYYRFEQTDYEPLYFTQDESENFYLVLGNQSWHTHVLLEIIEACIRHNNYND